MDFDAWRSDRERWGFRRALWRRLMIALRNRFVLCRVHVRVNDASKEPAAVAGGCSIRNATREQLLRAAEDPDMGLDAKGIDELLSRGDRCTAAFDGERMIAYVWRSFSSARWAPNVWVVFAKPYRYGYKSFTHPDYRGRRISTAMSLFMDRECIAAGYTHAISLIETHNFVSLAAERHRPAVNVGHVGYFSVRGRHYPFRTWGIRKHRFRLQYVADDRMQASADDSNVRISVPEVR